MASTYRYETTSMQAMVAQVASAYLPHGYWFYVLGSIPEGKAPELVDQKLLEKYDIACSRWARSRRKQEGEANVHYLRHERTFLLMATGGRHLFFEEEATRIRDARREPIHLAGYSISSKDVGGRRRTHVRIDRKHYAELKAYFLDIAVRRSPEVLERMLGRIPFEPYAPVRRQLLNLLRQVNRKRKVAGYARLPTEVLRFTRRVRARFVD